MTGILDENSYKILTMIEKFALESNGTIWGRYVTAKLLQGHFSNIYYNLDLPIDKFWDSSFHPETIERIFRYEELSICFTKVNNYDKFYSKCKKNNITISIKVDEDDEESDLMMSIVEHPELKINIILRSMDPEPPFGKVLFLCDGFIMHNVNNKTIIEYSRNTGTMFDHLPDKKFKIVENNIIANIYQKKTAVFIMDDEDIEILYKFINDGWKISNLPYSVFPMNYDITDTELIKFNTNNCPICFEKIFKDNKSTQELAVIYRDIYNPETIYYPIHHSCFIENILHENSKYLYCPYRFTINFDNCKKMINYDYYMLNSIKQKYIL